VGQPTRRSWAAQHPNTQLCAAPAVNMSTAHRSQDRQEATRNTQEGTPHLKAAAPPLLYTAQHTAPLLGVGELHAPQQSKRFRCEGQKKEGARSGPTYRRHSHSQGWVQTQGQGAVRGKQGCCRAHMPTSRAAATNTTVCAPACGAQPATLHAPPHLLQAVTVCVAARTQVWLVGWLRSRA
jgi:hypothetical protein